MSFLRGYAPISKNCGGNSALRRVPYLAMTALMMPALALATNLEAQTTIKVPSQQPTIQAGINAAENGDTVLVAPGSYNEAIDFEGKAITVTSSGGPNVTTISGGGNGTAGVTFLNSEKRSSVLSGFTVTGGILVYAGPTITGNLISGACNAISIRAPSPASPPLITNNTITITQAQCLDGDGIDITGLGTEIIGNIIEGVSTGNPNNAGGITIDAGEGTVIESNVIRNNSGGGAGGIWAYNTDALTVANNLFYGNAASLGDGIGAGGAIDLEPYDDSVEPFFGFVINNTFADNTVNVPQGYSFPVGQVFLQGNLGPYVFANNVAIGSGEIAALVCGTIYSYLTLTPLVIDHNDIYNATGAAYAGACSDQTGVYGNIAANPLFNSPSTGDYSLKKGSPAIDAGNNSALQLLANNNAPLTTDILGNPRVQDGTGKGYPVVDMGAYEFAGSVENGFSTLILTASSYEVPGGGHTTLTAQLLYSANQSAVSGQIKLYEDGSFLTNLTLNATGTASFTVTNMTPGAHAFLVTYAGNSTVPPINSVLIYVLVDRYGTGLTITSSMNPSIVNQAVTFTLQFSSANGVVNNAPLTLSLTGSTTVNLTTNAKGVATYTTNALSVGYDDIEAVFQGDSTRLPAYAGLEQQVVNGYSTTTFLKSSLNPANSGQAVTFTAQVISANGTPTGTVTFSNGTTVLGTQALDAGTGALTTSSLPVGSDTITATYNPSGSFAGSSASLIEVINGQPSSTTFSVTPNPAYVFRTVKLSAAVSSSGSTPSGSVSFSSNGTAIGTATLDSKGHASFPTTFGAAGTYALQASYSGNATLNASTSPVVEETVLSAATATALSVSPNPANVFQTVTFTAHISDTSPGAAQSEQYSGTVSFYDGKTLLGGGIVSSSGSAQYSTVSLTAGSHSITASYSGDSAHQPSQSAAVILVVNPDATTTTVTATPNPAIFGSTVTLAATVNASAIPSGTVTFFDGHTSLGQATLDGSGKASFQISTLSIGTHQISATYSATTNFLGSTSSAIAEVIVPFLGTFTVQLTPASRSIYTGETTTASVVVTPANGFNLNVQLACTGLPAATTCSFGSNSITGGGGATTLTIVTSAPHALSRNNGLRVRSFGILAFGLLLPFLPKRSRKALVILVASIFFIPFLSGCGSPGPDGGGTPPGTYVVNIVGTGGPTGATITASAPLKLTVKPLF